MEYKQLIQSPLNYTGGKYKILPQLLKLFPENITTFVDLFGGGFNVGANIFCNNVIYNDNNEKVKCILECFYKLDIEEILTYIKKIIEQFNLSKTNKEGYLNLRQWYNDNLNKASPLDLYTLICYSFNNQIRFNKNNEFNIPFGLNRSFNNRLQNKLINFCALIKNKNILFYNMDFSDYFTNMIESNHFIYCDPPYLNSVATYNEQNQWTEKEESKLLYYLDQANAKGVLFALSNNFKYHNPILDKWKTHYNVHYLGSHHNNCAYNKKDKNSKDIEVLITNY